MKRYIEKAFQCTEILFLDSYSTYDVALNIAAWICSTKADLEIDEALYHEPGPGEVLTKVRDSYIMKALAKEWLRMKP